MPNSSPETVKIISITLDGKNPARNQLRLVVYPIIYRVSYIPGGAGYQPSTLGSLGIPEPPRKKKVSSHPAGDEFCASWVVETCIPWRHKGFYLVVRKDLKLPSLGPLGSCFLRKNAWQKVLFFFWGAKNSQKKQVLLNQNMGHLVSRGVPGKLILPLSLEEVWFWKVWTQTLVRWV